MVLVGTAAVKHNRRLMDGRWDKHDTKDAANVADLISQGKCLYYEHPDLRLRELRNLLSLKRRLRRQEHGYRVTDSESTGGEVFSGVRCPLWRIGIGGVSDCEMVFVARGDRGIKGGGVHRESDGVGG